MYAFLQFLANPAIVSLIVGILIGIYTRYSFPKVISECISIYLIFSIGFKGGACLGVANACTPPLILLTFIGIGIGLLQPLVNYYILEKTTSLDVQTAAVVASQYGSISIITFITAITFLTNRVVFYDTFMTAIAGIMEIPALITGLWLIKKEKLQETSSFFSSLGSILKAILLCKKISMIFVGFFCGYLLRHHTQSSIAHGILKPFQILLVLFMIDVGIKIASQRAYIKKFTLPLIAFAVYMPLIMGCIGIATAFFIVNEPGSIVLFAVLLSSASYIAVPAVMRVKAKQAKEIIYLPLALGITLPFNILIGIPLYFYIVKWLVL